MLLRGNTLDIGDTHLYRHKYQIEFQFFFIYDSITLLYLYWRVSKNDKEVLRQTESEIIGLNTLFDMQQSRRITLLFNRLCYILWWLLVYESIVCNNNITRTMINFFRQTG